MQKKSVVVALCGIVLVGIGATWAVTHDLSVINNNLALANYQTTFTENFTSPPNWQTCQTVPKTITVTNNSNVPVAVRIKFEEDWIASDGTTHLPLVSATSGITMAQINFTANSGWTQDGQYYVYDTDLAPNATTSSLMTGVTLNCEANLDESADGAYGGAEYHLKATIQTIQADKKDEWSVNYLYDAVASQVNEPYEIDFTKKATQSDDLATANGNGVNKYTENNRDIYYFRGQIDNNNVIWADKCWKIIRTTYTGGVKMIYNGVSTEVDGVKQCLATGVDAQITYDGANTFKYNTINYLSPASVGYMYGPSTTSSWVSFGSTVFTFSNNVSRSGNIYSLDTSVGQFITGTFSDQYANAATKYHYFCTDGTTTCEGAKIGYIVAFDTLNSHNIYYLPINGYDNIEAIKLDMFSNVADSNAKRTIEAWFEVEGLATKEGDLEDAIFCNDRSYFSGALKSKDNDAMSSRANYHGAYGRNAVVNSDNNYEPSLDCLNKNDSFTKDDTANGNGMLKHKVGLITEDELTIAGSGIFSYDTAAYLYTGQYTWSISPYYYGSSYARQFIWGSYSAPGPWEPYSGGNDVKSMYGLRPLVSLKAGTTYSSGTGLKTDPYIVP